MSVRFGRDPASMAAVVAALASNRKHLDPARRRSSVFPISTEAMMPSVMA
jgi:hypothetical protein